jgi:hypothetical protein
VDFFSLDVEGAELSVLRTIDWFEFSASFIIMETREGMTNDAGEELQRAGYLLLEKMPTNHLYVHPQFKAANPSLF